MITDDVLALVERWRAVAREGELEEYAALYTPDAVVWKNFDNRERSVERAFREARWEQGVLTDVSEEDLRIQVTDRGFVIQATMRATVRSGGELVLPTCVVVSLEGELIARVDEYVDSATAAALFTG